MLGDTPSNDTIELWITARDAVKNREMPPEDDVSISEEERQAVLTYLDKHIDDFSPSEKTESHHTNATQLHFYKPYAPHNYTYLAIGFIIASLLVTLAIRHTKGKEGNASNIANLAKKIPLVSFSLVLLMIPITIEIISMRKTIEEKNHELDDIALKKSVHHATYTDYGTPPIPARPKRPATLSSTYYRGNDERSPKLFNHGYYRTATFHLQLVDQAGTALKHGDSINPSETLVEFIIDRAPNTPSYFFSQSRMGKMLLTKESQPFLGRYRPIADAQPFHAITPNHKFRATYPIIDFINKDGSSFSGNIYVCERIQYNSIPVGARIHYSIQFELHTKNNILSPLSDLWMGSIYRTRKLPVWAISTDEWFSTNEIPIIEGKQQTTDPNLLGITDHEKEKSPPKINRKP